MLLSARRRTARRFVSLGTVDVSLDRYPRLSMPKRVLLCTARKSYQVGHISEDLAVVTDISPQFAVNRCEGGILTC